MFVFRQILQGQLNRKMFIAIISGTLSLMYHIHIIQTATYIDSEIWFLLVYR